MAQIPENALRVSTFTAASAIAGPFDVGFRMVAETGLAVYVDAVLQSDVTINATLVDGYDDTATITFAAPLEIGQAVVIVGALIPYRAQDYEPGDPSLTRLLNDELTQHSAALIDLWRELRGTTRFIPDVSTGFAEIAPVPIPGDGEVLMGNGAGGLVVGPDVTALPQLSVLAQDAAAAAALDAADAALDAARAELAADTAEGILDNFDDRYLGIKSTEPVVDNDGDPLVVGALYYNNSDGSGINIWTGTVWKAFNAGVQTLADLGITATVEEVNKLNGVVGDIVGTEAEQNLLNKTLTTPLVNVGSDAPGDLYQRNAGGTGFERIAVGASGTALVSDGTKWVSGVSITTTDFIAQDRRASGVDGNTPTSNSWNKRVINSIVKTNAAISIAANNVTVAEGRWSVEVLAGGYRISRNQLRIVQRVPPAAFDPATGSTYGISSNFSDGNFVGGTSQVQGEIDATGGPVEFYIDHWTQNSAAGGLGVFSNSMGGVEIHLHLNMKRIG